MKERPARPTSETGIYLHKHEHEWELVGTLPQAKQSPAGPWHPVFTCAVCEDVICDLHVEVDELGYATSSPNKGRV